MEETTVDSSQPTENKCEEIEEPSSPNNKEEQQSKKITLIFHAIAHTPILRRRKYAVEATRKVAFVYSILRKLMNLKAGDSLFLYVNQAFAPGLDQTIENLLECFGAEGVLNFHYCTSQAWG